MQVQRYLPRKSEMHGYVRPPKPEAITVNHRVQIFVDEGANGKAETHFFMDRISAAKFAARATLRPDVMAVNWTRGKYAVTRDRVEWAED